MALVELMIVVMARAPHRAFDQVIGIGDHRRQVAELVAQPKLLLVAVALSRLPSELVDQSGQCGTEAEARVSTTRTMPAIDIARRWPAHRR